MKSKVIKEIEIEIGGEYGFCCNCSPSCNWYRSERCKNKREKAFCALFKSKKTGKDTVLIASKVEELEGICHSEFFRCNACIRDEIE